MTVAEMSADMVGQSEKIGVQTVKLEELLTVLKLRKNALHPDGTRLLTSEEALREPDSSVGLDVKVLISEYWSAFYALAELGRVRDRMAAQFQERMMAEVDTKMAREKEERKAEEDRRRGAGGGGQEGEQLGREDDEPFAR